MSRTIFNFFVLVLTYLLYIYIYRCDSACSLQRGCTCSDQKLNGFTLLSDLIVCVFFLDAKGVGGVWTAESMGVWGLYIAPHAKFSKFHQNATPSKMLNIPNLSSAHVACYALDAPFVIVATSNLPQHATQCDPLLLTSACDAHLERIFDSNLLTQFRPQYFISTKVLDSG